MDALGPSQVWQDKLSQAFPSIKFLVCPKADSLFKIVGAASIVAKVTRDRYIEHWVDVEGSASGSGNGAEEDEAEVIVRGSGYPSGESRGVPLPRHIVFACGKLQLHLQLQQAKLTPRPQDTSIPPQPPRPSLWLPRHCTLLVGDRQSTTRQARGGVPMGRRRDAAVCRRVFWRCGRQGAAKDVARLGHLGDG